MAADGRWGRLLVGLYPPAWRARYAEEFTALLADTGAGPRVTVNVLAGAAAAWTRPARRLHDRASRMRTSVTVALCAWTAQAAGAVLYAKVVADGALHRAGAGAGWYNAFVVAACVSTTAIAAGGLPLTAVMARRAPRPGRILALLALPAVIGPGFLGAAAVGAVAQPSAAPPAGGFGGPGFLVLAGLGVVAAAGCAAGPALAVPKARPDGPALTLAVHAGAATTAAMTIATIAGLAYQLTRSHQTSPVLMAYGLVMAAAASIAATSSYRGLRAAWTPNGVRGRAC